MYKQDVLFRFQSEKTKFRRISHRSEQRLLDFFSPLETNLPCVLLKYYYVEIFEVNATPVCVVCQGLSQNFGVIPEIPEISERSTTKATTEKWLGPSRLPIFLIAPVKSLGDRE